MLGPQFLAVLGAGALAGFLSIPHCAGMCGPLAGFACARAPGRFAALRYQLGRLVSYGTIGAVAGTLGGVVASGLMGRWAAALVSWSLAAALAIAAFRLWRTERPAAVVTLGRDRARPSLFARAAARLPKDALFIGLLTGLLPCGALAAAALLAAGTSTAIGGALVMVAFAATSSVALVGVALVARFVRRRPTARVLRIAAVALMVGAAVLVVRPIATLAGEPAACCDHE